MSGVWSRSHGRVSTQTHDHDDPRGAEQRRDDNHEGDARATGERQLRDAAHVLDGQRIAAVRVNRGRRDQTVRVRSRGIVEHNLRPLIADGGREAQLQGDLPAWGGHLGDLVRSVHALGETIEGHRAVRLGNRLVITAGLVAVGTAIDVAGRQHELLGSGGFDLEPRPGERLAGGIDLLESQRGEHRVRVLLLGGQRAHVELVVDLAGGIGRDDGIVRDVHGVAAADVVLSLGERALGEPHGDGVAGHAGGVRP